MKWGCREWLRLDSSDHEGESGAFHLGIPCDIPRKAKIVNNMHEAYARIEMDPKYNFGTFISGPSKTADIEQALVMGAQAARGVTVILL